MTRSYGGRGQAAQDADQGAKERLAAALAPTLSSAPSDPTLSPAPSDPTLSSAPSDA